MKKSSKMSICILLIFCILLSAGCNSETKETSADLLDVRNNGTVIQWKYGDETKWRDLVDLNELIGTSGQNGTDGINGKDGVNGQDGINGKNGIDGKTIEVRKADSYIQWRHENGEWKNLVALSDISGPAGQTGSEGKTGENGKTSEFRVDEDILQWRYIGDEVWLNLYELSLLKGADGTNGLNGRDGTNGDTPFIGENGNWWIGTTDTEVRAAGQDGKDGVCSGYFYGIGQNSRGILTFPTYRDASNGLIRYSQYWNNFTLKKGHSYSLTFSGSLAIGANDAGREFGAVLKDGYDDNRSANTTLVKFKADNYISLTQVPVVYSRIYNANEEDITLQLLLDDDGDGTYFQSFFYSLNIIALD